MAFGTRRLIRGAGPGWTFNDPRGRVSPDVGGGGSFAGKPILKRRSIRLPAPRYPGGIQGSYQRAQEEARAANEQRYTDILGGYRGREADVMGEMGLMGAQARADIASRGRTMQSMVHQDAIRRKVSGAGSLLPTMRMGAQRQTEAEFRRLDESLRGQRVGMLAGLRGETLGFMERREDEYPDLNQMIQLMQQLGYGGGGGGQRRLPIMERMRRARMAARGRMGR